MKAGWVLVGLGVGCGGVPATGMAQERVAVGPALEFVASDPTAVGLGPRFRWRLAREVGLATGASLVRRGGDWAGRGELTLQLRFGSWGGAKTVWYALGGLALVTGPAGGGFLVAGAGVETPAGKGSTWWGEIGVAGGARLAGGYQVRIRAPKR